METRTTARRASVLRKVGWLAVASMLALAVLAPSAGVVSAASGAIWTTSITCASPAPQDQNQYSTGDHVHIRGSGFTPSSTFDYSITGQPGGASSDPGIVVASGQVDTDSTGYFCVDAYTILPGDDGEYTVDVPPAKNDNYRVNGTTSTTTSSTTSTTSTVSSSTTETTTVSTSTIETSSTTEATTSTIETSSTTEATTSSTTTPTQSVEGATDVPSVTLPPTDSFGGSSGPSSDSWRILLLVGAALLASVLILNPNKASRRS